MSCCFGPNISPLMQKYHDEVWGKPCHDDHLLFKMLILECFQAGLSWEMVLQKEEAIGCALKGFDVEKVANLSEEDFESGLQIPNMIKNRRKMACAVNNAKRFMDIQREFGSFDAFIWSFTQGKVIDHRLTDYRYMPASNELSDEISAALKQRGFQFVGTIIVYSYLQAIGIINDHLVDCQNRGDVYE